MMQDTRCSIPHVGKTDKVILFDGVCRFCTGWSRFIIQADTKHIFKLAALQSPAGQDILTALQMPCDRFDTLVYLDGQQAYIKSDAVLGIALHLPWPWRWVATFRIIPKPFRDWLYDQVASRRYQLFGQFDRCLMPTPDHEQRFLANG
jgi:predicted DCC family thiol-disulfide oxidoreductase YuxK